MRSRGGRVWRRRWRGGEGSGKEEEGNRGRERLEKEKDCEQGMRSIAGRREDGGRRGKVE